MEETIGVCYDVASGQEHIEPMAFLFGTDIVDQTISAMPNPIIVDIAFLIYAYLLVLIILPFLLPALEHQRCMDVRTDTRFQHPRP